MRPMKSVDDLKIRCHMDYDYVIVVIDMLGLKYE